MLAGVLPSYSHTLTEECVGLSDPAQAQVCVAQRLARINQDAKGDGEQKARGLEMVGCSVSPASNGQLAFLSDDRAAILLHPGAGDQTRAACGRVEIDRLLSTGEVTGRADSGRVDADGGGFDEMLLLDRTGTVLYSAARTSGIRIGVLPGFDANKAAASQMARDVVIGGEKYRVFTQPFAFRVGHPGSAAESDRTKAGADLQPPDLVACGLIREDRLLSASINLSPASYLWGVLLVGFGILLLPLTKLWFVGARARFRTFDVAQLATSAVIATLLSVVLVFALIAHNSLSERLDGQLAHVAADLSSRLSRRIDQSIAALDAFTSQTQNVQRAIASNQPRELARDELKAACLPGEIMPGAMFEGDHSSWPVCERTHADLPTLAPGLKWNVAFLTNRLGFQQAKYTRDQHAPPPITVAEREYFRRAIAGRVACFDAGGTRAIGAAPCGRAPGIPQVVRSATSGDIVLLTSRPTYASPEGTGALSEQPTGIAAIETSLAGFQHPLLPLGFQMAVIDMDGIVMLHSDNDARHGQSLLDDLSTSWALRASLKARISDSLNLRYLGTPSRVHVEPLPGTEWFVLTIAPKTLIDSSIAEMVLVTMVGFGMTTLLLLMFAAGRLGWNVARAYRRSGGLLRARDVRHGLAVRPDGRYPQRYAQAGRSMALWSLAICAVVLVVPNVPLTVALLAAIVVACHSVGRLPGLSMERAAPRERGPWSTKIEDVVARIVARVGDFARVRREPQAAQPTETVTAPPVSPPSLRSAYALCCFGLAAVFVITPTVVIFASAYDHVTAALARAEQDHYATALRYDRRCIDTILWGTSACAVVGSGAERTLRPDNDVSDVFRPLALANLVRRRCLTAIRRQRRGEHRPALQGGQPRAPGQAADGLGVGEEARSRGARVGKRTRAAPHDGLADVDPRPLRLGVPRARDHGNAYCLCRWVPRLLSQHRATLFSPRD
jgi:hypothetical protein